MQSIVKKMRRNCGTVIVIGLLMFAGCASVGHEFNAQQVHMIRLGETTQNEIVSMFGQPWRKGIENGVTIWTYGHYTYRVIGETDTKDLVIKFNKEGKVSSYTFNTTMHEE